ncbi:MAG: hypothetical protein E7449_01375 [Ruminococcaceae bacterium]|nr:hypothetical protein [Oscillospiraceae bacterium]
MKKRRLFSFLLILAMLTGMVSAAKNTRQPYAIKVNRACNTVTIYESDENGQYTKPIKAMICSTGREGCETPLGTFYLIDYRSEWRLMLDGTYGQYATCFYGNFLFHSVCYADDSHDAMVREAYNNLGNAASMGCVRLQTMDAKWIFDNCPAGTPVTIYDDPDDPGPLGKPDKVVDEITLQMYNGWDPTDPAEGNPWNLAEIQSLRLGKGVVSLTAGDTAKVIAFRSPSDAMVFWYSNNEEVAVVDQSGNITALSEGSALITAKGIHGKSASCVVSVTGELLPYDDLVPGAWYYPHVRYAVSKKLFTGTAERQFSPEVAVSRAMIVQVLYNLAGRPAVKTGTAFEDVKPDDWYSEAVAWASSEGLVYGVSQTLFAPHAILSRQEMATIIWRYAGEPNSSAYLGIYADASEIPTYAKTAFAWMTDNYLLRRTDRNIRPAQAASRAELASVLSQAMQKGLIE